ncbi:MAG: hypothetical protein IJV69_07680 [Kiritimatiellae bacterium]|nr:hypothetical protein [Kiritimatiellia bacterium]
MGFTPFSSLPPLQGLMILFDLWTEGVTRFIRFTPGCNLPPLQGCSLRFFTVYHGVA